MQTRVSDAAVMGGPVAATGRYDEPAPTPTRISWGAVLAGALVAITVGAMLNVLGMAVGATTIDPTMPGETPSATSLGIGAGVWLLVANLIGLAVGGYVAARLSGNADGTDASLHGLSVWALAFLVSAVLLGNIVAGTARTAATGVSSMVGGLAQGAGNAASAVASQATDQVNPQALVDRLQNALSGGGDPAQMNSDQRRAEIGQILTNRVTSGNFAGNGRERLTQLVAAEYGIAPQEAQARVQQLETQAQQFATEAAQRAREAADAAANGAATGAYWIFAAMVLGALASVLGARMGTRGHHRVARREYA